MILNRFHDWTLGLSLHKQANSVSLLYFVYLFMVKVLSIYFMSSTEDTIKQTFLGVRNVWLINFKLLNGIFFILLNYEMSEVRWYNQLQKGLELRGAEKQLFWKKLPCLLFFSALILKSSQIRTCLQGVLF